MGREKERFQSKWGKSRGGSTLKEVDHSQDQGVEANAHFRSYHPFLAQWGHTQRKRGNGYLSTSPHIIACSTSSRHSSMLYHGKE